MHGRAIKLRRMSDGQLCAFMDATFGKGVEEGLRMAVERPETAPQAMGGDVMTFIDYLESQVGTGNKIGRGTILQLRRELQKVIDNGLLGRVAQ